MTNEKTPSIKIEVIAPEYEAGKPSGEGVGSWAYKLATRKDILKYLETAEGYSQEEQQPV